MPPLPPVPNVLKVAIQGFPTAFQPYPWANVLHFTWTGVAPTPTSMITIATDISTAWAGHISQMQANTTTMSAVTVTDLTSNTGAEATFNNAVPGIRGTGMMPADACVLVSYPVAVRYRGGHPRTYVKAGLTTDLVDDSHWNTGFVPAMKSAWDAFIAAVTAIAVSGTAFSTQVAVSYYDKNLAGQTNPPRRNVPLVYQIPAGTSVVHSELAAQRSRVGRSRA